MRSSASTSTAALVAELEASGVPVRFHNGNAARDETRAEMMDDLASFAEEAGAEVGVLLHSIAFGTLRPYFPSEEGAALGRRHLEMTVDVMANSLVYWSQDLVARGLLGRGARIFAMTSAGSLVAWPSYGAVSAAKAALESHIRQLAVELAPHGVTANAVMAGVTQTAALDKIPGSDALVGQALDRNPHGRLTTPDDIARCLVALSVPGTAWLTGNVLRVDGGETIAG